MAIPLAAVVRVPRAAAPRRDMDDPRQWPAPPIPCRRPAREIFAELEAEEARRRRAQPDLPKGKDLDHEKQNLQDRFRYCGGRMLPKGSMGYVEPGSVPPTGGAAEAATRRENRRRYDENGFDGEQREIFEDLVRAVQRKQARLAVIDDEQLADPKPSKAKTARNKEALELRNGIERDLKDIETLMSLAEGQAHKAARALSSGGQAQVPQVPVPAPAGYAPTAPAVPTPVYGDPVKESETEMRGGTLDRAGFMKLLDWVQVAMTAAEQELLFQRCSAGPGLLNYREVANQFDTSKQDANAKVSQLAAWWREHNANLADLFRTMPSFFDANGDNMLDKVEFTYLLQTADPYMPEHMAHTIFDLSASRGGVGYADFTRSFGITPESLPAPAPTPAPSPWLTAPEANSLTSVAIQSPAVRLGGGSRRGKLTKPHFEHLCLAVEPGLEARELLRLFGQARATQAIPGQSLPEEIDAADFVQRFGPDSPEPPRHNCKDMWALSALRRIAKAASAALTGPEHVFQKFDMDGNGCLSSLEFERFLRTQDFREVGKEPNLSEQDVTWLWRLADSDQDGQVVLHEFVWALRQLQIEADRAQPSTEPSTSKDQVIEVKVAQLARLLHKRGYSLEKALSVYDRKRSGFLTRDSFKELLRAAQFKLSDTEVDEVMLQCDTACDGLLDSRELLRRLSAAADRPKYQSSAPQPPGPPRNPQPPGHGPAPPAPAAAVLPPPAVPTSRPNPNRGVPLVIATWDRTCCSCTPCPFTANPISPKHSTCAGSAKLAGFTSLTTRSIRTVRTTTSESQLQSIVPPICTSADGLSECVCFSRATTTWPPCASVAKHGDIWTALDPLQIDKISIRKMTVGPFRLQVLGVESLAVVSLPGKGGEALDWLATALPAARNAGGAKGGCAALSAGGCNSTAVVVPESALRAVAPPPGANVDTPWAALEVSFAKRAVSDALVLASLAPVLSSAKVRWRALPAAQAPCLLLIREEDLSAASVALVRAGHAIGPAARVCPPRPQEDTAASGKNAEHVGAWTLTRREEPVGKTVEEPDEKGPLRLQAPSGVYVEVRLPQEGAKEQASCAGIHSLVEVSGGRQMSVRHRVVDFRPPTGRVLCTQVKFDKEVMAAELSYPHGRFRDEYIEAWSRIHSGPMAALELISEEPSVGPSRTGYWIFCGSRFGRVIGLPVGQGIASGTCCGSLEQLEVCLGGASAREELHTRYEAVWGDIERPGRLRIREEVWSKSKSGDLIYDQATGVGGTLTFGPSEVLHCLPNGVKQRWRIRDWGFDPFRPGGPLPAPPGAEAIQSDDEFSSSSSSSSASNAAGVAAAHPAAPKAAPGAQAVPAPVASTPPAPVQAAVAVAAAASRSRSHSSSSASRRKGKTKDKQRDKREKEKARSRDRRRRQASASASRHHRRRHGRRRRDSSQPKAPKAPTPAYPFGAYPPQAAYPPFPAGKAAPPHLPAYPPAPQAFGPPGFAHPPPGYPPHPAHPLPLHHPHPRPAHPVHPHALPMHPHPGHPHPVHPLPMHPAHRGHPAYPWPPYPGAHFPRPVAKVPAPMHPEREDAPTGNSNGAAASLASGAKTLPPKAAGPTPKVEGIGSAWGQPAGAPPPGAPHANGALGASWGDPVPAKAPAAPADPRVDWFCRQHGLDAVVERRLRQLAPDAQRRVMDEGPIGANPSFEVTSRIHRIEAWEHGHHVSSFCAHHIVSPQAQDALKALSPDIARKVMSTPLTSPDPSSELLARCNDAGKDGLGQAEDPRKQKSGSSSSSSESRSRSPRQ
eukprot:s2642_g3.t1